MASTGTGHAVAITTDRLKVIVNHYQVATLEGQLSETAVGTTERVSATVGSASGTVDAGFGNGYEIDFRAPLSGGTVTDNEFVTVTVTVAEEGPGGDGNSLSRSLFCHLDSTGDGFCW